MEHELIPVRAFISPNEAFFEEFAKLSDTPLINTRGTGSMFSLICPDRDAFDSLLGEIGMHEEDTPRLRETFDKLSLGGRPVAVFFSDERSGSNRIDLMSANEEGESLSVEMIRRRGLTMDMAYTFFFMTVGDGIRKVVRAEVTDSDEEAKIW
ncbi:MAG: hypothetical protein IKD81_07480 [Eubacteriaceae bacterium]|nr:hypothetical protein [Eubacteriaceae bacterium]